MAETIHQCFQCSYRYEWAFQYDYHVFKKHKIVAETKPFHNSKELELYACSCGDFTTYHKLNLYEHYNREHNARSVTFRNNDFWHCDKCQYATRSSLFRIKHACKVARKRQNQGNVNISCTKCSYRCKLNEIMKRHVMLTHASEIDWFNCAQCSYRSKKKRGLKAHMLSHASPEGP